MGLLTPRHTKTRRRYSGLISLTPPLDEVLEELLGVFL